MAFSTQKNFMKIDPLLRRSVPLEPKDSYSAGIKHYFSCYDARAWSFDSGQQNLYLSDVIGCCQDNYNRPCTPVCYCTDREECGRGGRNRYDSSKRRHSSRDANELSEISNTVKNESGQGIKRRSESTEIIRDEGDSSQFVDQNGRAKTSNASHEFDRRSKISKHDNQKDDKLKTIENDSESIKKETHKVDPHETHSDYSKSLKELIRQSENEKLENELVEDADPSSSDHIQNIEIFDVNENEQESPSTGRDASNNESSLSDNIIRDSTLEFIFNNEMAKDRRPWEISYDFPRPVSQRPPIGYFVGEGDCEERRQHVRELIKTKGEETVAELMQVLHNYEKKFEYYKRICWERKAQLESGDKIQLQQNPLTRRNGRNSINLRPKPQRHFARGGHNGPTALNRRKIPDKPSLAPKLTTISYMHPQFKPRSVTNLANYNLRSNPSENSLPQSSTPSDRRHRHEELFFHKPTSIFHLDNTKRALNIAEDNMDVFTNNIDVYSKELVGAVQKLTKVIQEFAEFKDTIQKVLKVDENNHNIIRPDNVAGPSGVRNPARRSHRRQDSTSSLELKGRHFPGGMLKRKSAGADGNSTNNNGHSMKRYELLERCRNTLAEIHKHFTKQKHHIRNVNACKGQWADILKTHREAFIKLHQHNCRIHRKSEQIREFITDIEASLDEVKVTGFTKYRSKAGCSTQTAPSSQSLLCYDLGVDLHIENLSFEDFPSDGKMKKVLEAKITKMQSEIELISEQITYKTMVCNCQLEKECQVLKEKEATEKAVLKMCRKIRALEANALKIKTAMLGKDKIVYNPFEQFCSKRALKRIKALQLDLQKIQATAEFKANLLQAAREAKDRRMVQNQNLKQDIDTAKKTIEELENYIKKFQSVVCGEIYKQDEEIAKPKKSSTSSSSSSSRPPAKILRPSPATPASDATVGGTTADSTEYLVDEKQYVPVDNPDEVSFKETSNSDMHQKSSQGKSMSSKQAPTSEIEVEIPPTVNSPIKEAPSLVVIKPPVEFQSSESSGEKKFEKLSVDHDTASLSRSEKSPSLASETQRHSSKFISNESQKVRKSLHSTKESDINEQKSSSMKREIPLQQPSKTSSIKSTSSSRKNTLSQYSSQMSRSIKSQKTSITSPKSVLMPSRSSLKAGTSNKLHQKSFDKRKSDVISGKGEAHETTIPKKSILSALSLSSMKTTSNTLRKSKGSYEGKSKQKLIGSETSKHVKSTEASIVGKIKSSEKSGKELRKSRGSREFTAQLSKTLSKTSLNDKKSVSKSFKQMSSQGITTEVSMKSTMSDDKPKISQTSLHEKSSLNKSFKQVSSSGIKKQVSKKSTLSDDKVTPVRVSSQLGGSSKEADSTASLNQLETGKQSTPNVEKSFENIITESQHQHSNLTTEHEKLQSDIGAPKTSIAKMTDNFAPQESKTKFEGEIRKPDINSAATEDFIMRAKDEESMKSVDKPETFQHDGLEVITEDHGPDVRSEPSLLRDNQPESFHQQSTPQRTNKVSSHEMNPAEPQLSKHHTSTDIVQNHNQEVCIECFSDLEKLRLELLTLKEKSQQLSDSEVVYQNQIKRLEGELHAAKQLYQLQASIQHTQSDKDCTEWMQKHKLTADEIGHLKLLYTQQTEALEVEHSKNLEYQQETASLQINLMACQQELQKLQEIHSKCKPLIDEVSPDFSEWTNKVQTLQAEISKLREALRTKDEQLKELQNNQARLRDEPSVEEYKSKWLSTEAELKVCQKQLEALYNGGNDPIVKELNEQLAIYEQENTQLRHKAMQADNDVANIGQRLSAAIQNLNCEKQVTADLRRKIQEYQSKLNGSENIQDRLPKHASKLEYETIGCNLSTKCVNAILEKQNSTLRYLCQLQTSVQDLLAELRSGVNNSGNESGSDTMRLGNTDEIRDKIYKICTCLKRLGMQNKSSIEECTCSKKSRLEKICAKILQKGISCLKWEDLSYLHEIVYKTGCAMRGLSVCKKPEECQCCGDAARNSVHSGGGTPIRKINKMKQEVNGVRDLIQMLKNEYREL